MAGKKYEGFKEGFKEGFREGLREKARKKVKAELKKELEPEVRKELREKLVDEVKAELRAELREEIQEGCLKEYIENFKKGFVEGFPKGTLKGQFETLRRLAADGVLSSSEAARYAGTTEAEFCEKFGLSAESSSDATPDGGVSEKESTAETRAPEEGASDETGTNENEKVEISAVLFEINQRAQRIGVEEGRVKTLRQLVVDGVLTIAEAADRASTSIPAFEMKTVRTEDQQRAEYEAFRDSVRDKYERLFSFPGFETFVNDAIVEGRRDGVALGMADVLNQLVADGVLTQFDLGRYV